ncbi:hypothetical protein HPB49_007490 [Dermacentor silvarum]|uniref:Uncharacterized protein n=1 Tax=Dermacentor silvarum TaxID=543639 RepID=A0ACB8CW40_DERSI|nr:hypothetical protein HPB49_007490 [Dermacentor silvarum]
MCLSMGHPAEVCPTSNKPRCVACGASNPLPEHELTSKYIHWGGDHPAVDTCCPSRQQQPFSKSYVLQENLKREKPCLPPGSAHSQPRTTVDSLRDPDQPIKTPENSTEEPLTSGRSSIRGPPLHERQVDRGRPDNPSKERTTGSDHPKPRGQQKGAHKKEQTIAQITHMIHHITNRRSGLRENDDHHVVQALRVIRLAYHFRYHKLTLTESEKMDILLRKVVKAALGLLPHASTRRLLQLGVPNTITELLEAQQNSQVERLRQSPSELRHILSSWLPHS